MRIIDIQATAKSPKVIFDPETRLFEMQGNSRPENVRDFYYPIINKFKTYFEAASEAERQDEFKDKPIRFNFRLDYFNSSSAKFISDILLLINEYHGKGFHLKVYWYFEDGDEDMKEVGEDFSEMVNFPFNYVMVQR